MLRGDERVLLVTHLERGFSLPPHPFFHAFLDFFGAQLHHLPPNAVVYLAAFISLCENFLGCPAHWGLYKHLFTCRVMTVKRSTQSGKKMNVAQLCGGLGIQLRGKVCFSHMTFLDSVKGWQESWFYCQDIPVGEGQSGLSPYSSERVRPAPKRTVSKEEKVEVDILVIALVVLVQKGINGLDLLEVFFQRSIQPLQVRAYPMWKYTWPSDAT